MPVLSNTRHELFAQAVANGTDIDTAYVQAGYKRNINNASRVRSYEVIQTRIDELLADAAKASGVTREKIVSELAVIAFSDITQVIHWGEAVAVPIMREGEETGEFTVVQAVVAHPSNDLPPDTARAICEVRKTKDGIAFKMHSKTDALGKLAGIFGMITKDGSAGNAPITNTTNIQINANMTPQQMADEYVRLVRGV